MATKTKKETPAQEFMRWLKEEKKSAYYAAMGSASSWNHAYSEAFDEVYDKAKKLFGVKKPNKNVTKSVETRLNNKVN